MLKNFCTAKRSTQSHKFLLWIVVIFTARFSQSSELKKNILKSAEINIYPLCFVLFILATFCTLHLPPFATFCRSGLYWPQDTIIPKLTRKFWGSMAAQDKHLENVFPKTHWLNIENKKNIKETLPTSKLAPER